MSGVNVVLLLCLRLTITQKGLLINISMTKKWLLSQGLLPDKIYRIFWARVRLRELLRSYQLQQLLKITLVIKTK